MRKLIVWALGAVVAGAALVGCGDKGSAGGGSSDPIDPKSPVGAWKAADMGPMLAMMKPMLEMTVKMAEGMLSGAADPAAKAETEKKLAEAKNELANLDKMEIALTLKKDGTAAFSMTIPGKPAENATGTWSQAGETVTVVMKTENGKPAEGKKAEPKTLTFKDNTLTMTEEGQGIVFKRK